MPGDHVDDTSYGDAMPLTPTDHDTLHTLAALNDITLAETDMPLLTLHFGLLGQHAANVLSFPLHEELDAAPEFRP